MNITFDKEADALYIEVSEGSFARNKILDDETVLDLDANEQILGIEILNVSKRMSKNFLSDIRVQNLISK